MCGKNSTVWHSSDLWKTLLCFQVLDPSAVQGMRSHKELLRPRCTALRRPHQLVVGTRAASPHPHPQVPPRDRSSNLSSFLYPRPTPLPQGTPWSITSPLNLPNVQDKESLFISVQEILTLIHHVFFQMR